MYVFFNCLKLLALVGTFYEKVLSCSTFIRMIGIYIVYILIHLFGEPDYLEHTIIVLIEDIFLFNTGTKGGRPDLLPENSTPPPTFAEAIASKSEASSHGHEMIMSRLSPC